LSDRPGLNVCNRRFHRKLSVFDWCVNPVRSHEVVTYSKSRKCRCRGARSVPFNVRFRTSYLNPEMPGPILPIYLSRAELSIPRFSECLLYMKTAVFHSEFSPPRPANSMPAAGTQSTTYMIPIDVLLIYTPRLRVAFHERMPMTYLRRRISGG
jgi:hypothetical protein